MNFRSSILTPFLAMSLTVGGVMLFADETKETKDAKPVAEPAKDPAKVESPKQREKDEKRPRPEGSRPEGSRGDWGPRTGGPGGPGGPGAMPNRFEQFSADELRLMIELVEPKNKRLADKMRERFAESLAKKPTQLTDEQLADAMGIFEDREPYLASRLKESLKENKDRVSAMLAFQWPRLEKTIELKKSDRELYDAQTAEILKQGESRGIAWKLRKATQEKNQAEVTKLKDDLKLVLAEQHKKRQAIRQLELARMNEKIGKLSAEITAEEAKSAESIEKHYNDMLKWIDSPWGRGDKDRHEKGDKGEKKEKPE